MKFSTLTLTCLLRGAMAIPSRPSQPPSASGHDLVLYGPQGPQTQATQTGTYSEVCILFGPTNKQWHYAVTGPWGDATGTFASLPNNKICVPTTTTKQGGGAIFIGPDPNPGPGSTKLECFFPHSGTAYCDVSLVDGYSLDVACAAKGSAVFGGGANLWDKNPCPDKQGPNCINTNGYGSSQNAVPEFFQPAVQGKNNYCIWQYCSQQVTFSMDVASTMGCFVAGEAE